LGPRVRARSVPSRATQTVAGQGRQAPIKLTIVASFEPQIAPSSTHKAQCVQGTGYPLHSDVLLTCSEIEWLDVRRSRGAYRGERHQPRARLRQFRQRLGSGPCPLVWWVQVPSVARIDTHRQHAPGTLDCDGSRRPIVKKGNPASVAVLMALLSLGCPQPRSSAENDGPGAGSSRDCNALEPENPYSEGSGHYAGFEWAERNDPGTCGGNSISFIEGCQEFQSQSAAYEACAASR
jgi:hypothetical protein